MTARAPVDRPARARAATDLAANVVVSAGAGTGKTSLLVERLLNVIGEGRAAIHEIAAITFTEKAAGELRGRLAVELDALRAGSGDGCAGRAHAHLLAAGIPPERIASRAAAAIDGLDAAMVTTIHGLCAEILREHPLASRVPPGFVVDVAGTWRRLAVETWGQFVAAELGPDGRRAEVWAAALASVSLADLEAIALRLAGGGIPDDALAGRVASVDLRAALSGTASRWARELREATATEGLTPAPREWLEQAEAVLLALATSGADEARRLLAASPRLSADPPSVRTAKVAPERAAAIERLRARVRRLIAGVRAWDEPAVEAALAAVLPFVRELRERALVAGLLDFDALLVRARDLLRDSAPAREAQKRRFRAILVDEIQDTDPIQYEIVFFAAERPGDFARDAYATRLSPGSLFIVGDAKQSIYRFRGADPAATRRAIAHVLDQGGVSIELTANFRSTDAIVSPVNALFARRMPEYAPIHAERGDGRPPSVEIWTPAAAGGASERRRIEGRALAAEIAAVAGPGRRWRHDEVLVLLRSFSDLGPYLRALREARIPFVVSGGRRFLERTEIVFATALLRAVANPDDEVALLAYLRSPAGGVPDTELAAHAAAGGRWGRALAADPGACPALARALTRLAALREIARTRPVDAAIREILDASGLVVLSGLAFEAAQRVANLEKLVLAASALARDGRLTLLETLDALAAELGGPDEGDSPVADEATRAVRVMTIHKAKGLEAPLVVLADAAGGRRHRSPDAWSASMTEIDGRSFVRLEGPQLRNAASVVASLADAEQDAAEDLRLLYVALTRACDRLIVLADDARTPWIDALEAWGYDGSAPPPDGAALHGGAVLHRVLGDRAAAPAADPEDRIGAPDAARRYREAMEAVERHAAPAFRSPSGADATPVERASADEGSPRSRDLARGVGTIVHARLAGLPAAGGAEPVAGEAEAILARFDASPLKPRLDALDVLGREVPLLLDDGGARWRGTIDLVYRDEDGTVVAADYKTDARDDGAIERHGEQLRVYERALARAFPSSPVRAELWMLRSGRVIRLPAGTPPPGRS